jgi:hypothetical protein
MLFEAPINTAFGRLWITLWMRNEKFVYLLHQKRLYGECSTLHTLWTLCKTSLLNYLFVINRLKRAEKISCDILIGP